MRVDCERCRRVPCYCREHERRRAAEHLHAIHATALPGDGPAPALDDAGQRRWLAVADAARDMER